MGWRGISTYEGRIKKRLLGGFYQITWIHKPAGAIFYTLVGVTCAKTTHK